MNGYDEEQHFFNISIPENKIYIFLYDNLYIRLSWF